MAGAACEDGSICTVGDRCDGSGGCVPGPGCSDGNLCTNDVCGASSCTYPANTAPCSDPDPCTVGDTCSGGVCQPGSVMLCDDGFECTADRCEAGACVHDPLSGIPCGGDTIDPCITFSCLNGLCRGRPRPGCCTDC
jgi:hypothetical protein